MAPEIIVVDLTAAVVALRGATVLEHPTERRAQTARRSFSSNRPAGEADLPLMTAPREILPGRTYLITWRANPTVEHLVDRLVDWPGCTSLHHLDGRRTMHKRPKGLFREEGPMPESVELAAIQPPCSAAKESAADWASRVRAAVEGAERVARELRLGNGKGVLGRKAVLRASAFDSPGTPEPRRNLRPAIACRDKQRRIAELENLVDFRRRHAAAAARFRAGDHKVEFPAGTYQLRQWGARCAPSPTIAVVA